MAKRFTDTTKWFDPSFRKLPEKARWLWLFINDQCDNAGIWKVDFELFQFISGHAFTREEFLEHFGSKIRFLDDDRVFILGFVPFQYGELSEKSRPHLSAIKALLEAGIDPKPFMKDEREGDTKDQAMQEEPKGLGKAMDSLCIGLAKGSLTLKDKDKDNLYLLHPHSSKNLLKGDSGEPPPPEKIPEPKKKPLAKPPGGVGSPGLPKRSGQAHPETPQLVAAYVRAFQSRFPGIRPDLSGKVRGQISRYLAEVGLDAAIANIEKYLAIEDDWFREKGYDFPTFLANQNKVLTQKTEPKKYPKWFENFATDAESGAE